MRERELHSARQIVNALGGIKDVAELTGVRVKAVYHWLYVNQFPSHTYVTMQIELYRLQYFAWPHLWKMTGFAAPRRRRSPKA